MRCLWLLCIWYAILGGMIHGTKAGSCNFIPTDPYQNLLQTEGAWFYQSGLGIRVVPPTSPIENGEFQLDVLVDAVAEYLPVSGQMCMNAGLAPFFEADRPTLIKSLNLTLCQCSAISFTVFPRPDISELRYNISTDCSAVSGYEDFDLTFTVKFSNGSYEEMYPGAPTTREQPLFYNHTANVAFVAFELSNWPWDTSYLTENTVISLDYRAVLSFAQPVAIYSDSTDFGSLVSAASGRGNASMFFDRGYLVDGIAYLPTVAPISRYLDPTLLPSGFELPIQKPFCTRVPLSGGGFSPFIKWTNIQYDPYLVAVFSDVPDATIPGNGTPKSGSKVVKIVVPVVLCSVAIIVAVFLILALKVPSIGKHIIPAAHRQALA